MKVEITSNTVSRMQLATKVDDESGNIITRISVESILHPADIARLLNLQKNKAPLFFSVGSQQAQLDLEFFTIRSEKVDRVEPPPDLVECPTCHGKRTTLDEETRIDVACSTCRGTGLVPAPQPEVVEEPPASTAPEVTESIPVAQVNLKGNGAKPRRRSKKVNQTELHVT